MDAGVLVPLAVFAFVALLVAITSMAKLRGKEMEVHQRLYMEELEHQRKMKELVLELERVKSVPPSLSPSFSESRVKALSD